MNEAEYHALAAVQFSSALTPNQVWGPMNYHVDGLHTEAVETITRSVQAAVNRPDSAPIGLVLSGDAGVGKTHMLGWLRRYVQNAGGTFFMPKLLDGQSFWTGAVHGVVTKLRGADGQLGRMLDVLAERTGCEPELRMRLRGNIPMSRSDLDEFVTRIGDLDADVAFDCADTLRALVLYQANRGTQRDIGSARLSLTDGIDDDARREWGFRSPAAQPQVIFHEMLRVFALAGPIVLAVDQIDSVIARSGREDDDHLANRLADGLMRLREETTRTLIVAACIPQSWKLIAARTVNSAADRFRVLQLRTAMPSADTAAAIVAGHLGSLYGEAGFEPPYPTWPVLPRAFDDRGVTDRTPRRLLQLVEQHVHRCLAARTVYPLERFDEAADDAGTPPPPVASELDWWDVRFTQLRNIADTAHPLDPDHEDQLMPRLLDAALRCFILEIGTAAGEFTVDPADKAMPALHGRLRRTLDAATEDEEHWSFRAIAHPHHSAVLYRLRAACLEAEIAPGTGKRHLVILRNRPFSDGKATTAALAELEAGSGITMPLSEDDLRTFTALAQLFIDAATRPGFGAWLQARRPAGKSDLLGAVLPPEILSGTKGFEPPRFGGTVAEASAGEDVENHSAVTDSFAVIAPRSPGHGPAALGSASDFLITTDLVPQPPRRNGIETGGANTAEAGASGPAVTVPPSPDRAHPNGEPVLRLGRNVETGAEFGIPAALLRKHTVVFAGSGSGKTVLLRRLVEEAALHGISSILIDTNNDLARLGERWPAPPANWNPGDAQRAEEYFAETEVIVWTPRRSAGRPLALNPLPDLGGVLDDADEFRIAIDASVAGLLPRTGLTSRKLRTGTAVLTEALRHFARTGGGELNEFVALLADLPEDVSTVRDAARLARDMADELHAAMINDPVFGGAGERLDPGTLLTPSQGKRARVSVINCIGLATVEQRQTFVGQLEMALFAWIKAHPAGDRPLGGLLVLDEAQTFAPSRGTTASTEATLLLATQARKYGLGLVYATQAPKALHNMVSGNAATQFIGLLNAPVHIQAAQELARSKGGRLEDISRLPNGRFYGATEGTGFGKLGMPMCLSHHPPTALTEDEVLLRARRE